MSLADFQQNWLLKLAVQRALEIVSEASRHIPEELLDLAPDIP
ncbi:HepT-like ribonuclease domain-containing protein [Agrobacterium sp. ST15.13.095]